MEYVNEVGLGKGNGFNVFRYCTKPLSTIQCNKTLCRDQLVPILLIG